MLLEEDYFEITDNFNETLNEWETIRWEYERIKEEANKLEKNENTKRRTER